MPSLLRRPLRSALSVAMLLATAVTSAVTVFAAPQVVLDHILVRVNGRIITESDVRAAKALKLVDDTTSDANVQIALENRLLILEEIARSAPLPPQTTEEVDRRRAEWEASLGGAAKAESQLGDRTMSASAVDAWLRDDLRIRAYLSRQFGSLPESDRASATADWLGRLRQRAGLD